MIIASRTVVFVVTVIVVVTTEWPLFRCFLLRTLKDSAAVAASESNFLLARIFALLENLQD